MHDRHAGADLLMGDLEHSLLPSKVRDATSEAWALIVIAETSCREIAAQ